MTSIWAAAIVLGGCVLFHELGHFIVARLAGVEVTTFSVGFGPRLFGIKRGPTDYRLSLIPLGGYVRMLGEHPDEELDPAKKPFSFSHKPVGRRLAIVAAGPISNLILAVLIFSVILLLYGQPTLLPEVGKVLDGYPAQAAGIEDGDIITALDGRRVETWDEMADLIKANPGRPMRITVTREGRTQELTMVPKMGESSDLFGEAINKPMIGISPSGRTKIVELDLTSALLGGFVQTWEVTRLTAETVVRLVQARIPFSTLGGPIFIAQAAGRQAKAGLVNLFFLMGLLSVNLAILNILPVPVLDGGHLLFFGIEAVFRRPVSVKTRERAQQVGLVLILIFFSVVFYNDIIRLITSFGGPQ